MIAIVQVVAKCASDQNLRVALAESGMRGMPFSVTHVDGRRLEGTIARAWRRLGRKHGKVAQYLVELE